MIELKQSNYVKDPVVMVEDNNRCCRKSWDSICAELNGAISGLEQGKVLVVIECYQGILHEEVEEALSTGLHFDHWINASDYFLSSEKIDAMVLPELTDDRVFGRMTERSLADFMDAKKMASSVLEDEMDFRGVVVVYGTGAALLAPKADILVYADMARWEIQQRMRKNLVDNLGVLNREQSIAQQYKRGYFLDWRLCDKLKVDLMDRWDYVLDTNTMETPIMVPGEKVRKGIAMASKQPFRVVPFFDPGPWGGQWMKEVCDLDRSKQNFAWCFDCVPEENSLLLGFGPCKVEIPAMNLVLKHPQALLGEQVYNRFGAEFPIRFDFLDTMGGGNLSLQVHPLTAYIKEHFNMDYTQDESYYMLDATDDAFVYLGFKEGVNPPKVIEELKAAQNGGPAFEAEKHVQKFEVKKHDHVLIPAGTVHCSGKNSMVLEISATPYIFTFKLWDWGRMGLDGKPRPIHIEHGEKVIQWDRTASWTEKELVNCVEELGSGDGWREERTGLHASEFIETRRHWFTVPVQHHTNGGVNVLNLVEGAEAVVESPTGAFDPFLVHYAETFIIPASVGAYTIRPTEESAGNECATLKAFVRT